MGRRDDNEENATRKVAEEADARETARKGATVLAKAPSRPRGPLAAADREAVAAAVASGKTTHPRLGTAVGTCPECGLPVFPGPDSGHALRHAPEEDPHRNVDPALEIE